MKTYNDHNVNGFHTVEQTPAVAFSWADYAAQQAEIAAKRAVRQAVRLSIHANTREIADRVDEIVNAILGINA